MSRPHVVRDPAPSDPRRILLEAVEWAEQQRIPVVATGEPGVVCTSTFAPTWERAPGAVGVNPLGAAVLRAQPNVSKVDAACFAASRTSIAWCTGFAVGLAGFKEPSSWKSHIARAVIDDGYVMGLEFRVRIMTVVCSVHPDVRHAKTVPCRKCAATPGAATDDEGEDTLRDPAGKWEV